MVSHFFFSSPTRMDIYSWDYTGDTAIADKVRDPCPPIIPFIPLVLSYNLQFTSKTNYRERSVHCDYRASRHVVPAQQQAYGYTYMICLSMCICSISGLHPIVNLSEGSFGIRCRGIQRPRVRRRMRPLSCIPGLKSVGRGRSYLVTGWPCVRLILKMENICSFTRRTHYRN